MPWKSDPDKKAIATCKACGKEFTYWKCQPRMYCSKACYDQARAATVIATTCPTCGKEFTYFAHWPRIHCSNVCSGKANVSNIPNFKPTAYISNCEECGKEYTVKPSSAKGRFCSKQCAGKAWSRTRTGDNHPNKGRKFGRNEERYGSPITATCVVCGKEFTTKASHLDRRKCCSKACLGVLQSETFAGEGNPVWRGGHEPYYGSTWERARNAVRERDGYRCRDCGIAETELSRELDVHHLRRFADYGRERHEEANRLDNLISLCPACHTKREWHTPPETL